MAVAFVATGLLLAYLFTTFTYGQDPEDGVIDFSRPTQTAPAGSSAASGAQAGFGTRAASIFSQFDSTATLSHNTATPTLTPTLTPVSTEEEIRRRPDATSTRRPANTKPPATATKKPNPTSTGTKVPTKAPPPTNPPPTVPPPTAEPPTPETPASPVLLPGGGLLSGGYSLQASHANLAGPAGSFGAWTAAGYGGESREGGACRSFLCRLIARILREPGEW